MKVTKIKAFPSLERKKNVAAYARVSSGKDAMLHSLSSQVSYYSKYIKYRISADVTNSVVRVTERFLNFLISCDTLELAEGQNQKRKEKER